MDGQSAVVTSQAAASQREQNDNVGQKQLQARADPVSAGETNDKVVDMSVTYAKNNQNTTASLIQQRSSTQLSNSQTSDSGSSSSPSLDNQLRASDEGKAESNSDAEQQDVSTQISKTVSSHIDHPEIT